MRNTPERHQQLGEFFTANADRLERAVARKIYARQELIADACADAWTILLRRPDITLDQAGFRWLVTVAINEARALLHRTRGETPVGTFQGDSRDGDDDVPEPADTGASGTEKRALELIEHAELVELFRELKLKPREREALYLKALGYSYHEIERLTDSTYTAVDRRLKEGRARLRRLQREGDKREDGGQGETRGGRTPRRRGLPGA
jgi:RNA polymerase sigma factor (sigma-70 family)